eukprot:535746-Amphidinium_carterae.1
MGLLWSLKGCGLKNELSLSGTLPDSPRFWEPLVEFSLGNNKIGGSLPQVKPKQIVLLSFPENAMTGAVPSSYSSCSRMQSWVLAVNEFAGALPELDQLEAMTKLDFSHNKMASTVPKVGLSLERMLLQFNEFTGRIPTISGDLLGELDLGYNRLSGLLPNGLKRLTLLRDFTLPYNNFFGVLPEATSAWQQLELLALDHNHFSGSISAFSSPVLHTFTVHGNRHL